MEVREQLALLLGDVRQTRWSPASLERALTQGRQRLAQAHLLIEKRSALVTVAGQQFAVLPSDHIQTMSVMRGNFAVHVCLRDVTDTLWTLVVAPPEPHLRTTLTLPAGERLLAGTPPHALRLTSPDLTLWYVTVSPVGALVASLTLPSGTVETRRLQLRDSVGRPWYPAVSNVGALALLPTGTAQVSGAPLRLQPLTRVEPEGLQRIDPIGGRTGTPRQYTIEAKRLSLWPLPDGVYELEHGYYATDLALFPQEAEALATLQALAWLLPVSDGRGAAAQVQGMTDLEAELHGLLANAEKRDALASIPAPAS